MRGSGRSLALGAAKRPECARPEAHQQVIGAAELLAMGRQKYIAQWAMSERVVLIEDQLIGIGAAIVPDRDRLAAPDELVAG